MHDSAARPLLAAFEVYYDELLAFVRRRVNCPAFAADIVQDTYVRVASGGLPTSVANPRAFLYRVAGNLALDHLRREATRSAYVGPELSPAEVSDPQPSAETAIESRQRLALLMRAVEELPPRCRQVFVLRKVDGLDQAEIAQTLGISRNMVEKHLRKALLHCALRLRQAD